MNSPHTVRRQLRGNPLLQEKRHDPYRSKKKLRSARCPDCGATFRNGRWQWPQTGSAGLGSERCPACRRIADRYPAGELVISGNFGAAHRDELLAHARNIETDERGEHALHRIMNVEERGAEIVVTTTDLHLPHRIGHALKDAWGGNLKTHYDLGGYFTRVLWERND